MIKVKDLPKGVALLAWPKALISQIKGPAVVYSGYIIGFDLNTQPIHYRDGMGMLSYTPRIACWRRGQFTERGGWE